MESFLHRIIASKKEEVASQRLKAPIASLRSAIQDLPPTRDLSEAIAKPGLSIIAEIKQSSPSAGVLTKDFDHRVMAAEYTAGGAAGLSVLTEQTFFRGSLSFLKEVRAVSALPVLRKDFIIDEYQVFETRAAEADAVLLIARILEIDELRKLNEASLLLGLQPLVEVHDENDIEKALEINAHIIGINNRDLSDFSVSLERSRRLRPMIPGDALTVSESGIRGIDDTRFLKEIGFDAVLVGEGLVRAGNRAQAVRELLVH